MLMDRKSVLPRTKLAVMGSAAAVILVVVLLLLFRRADPSEDTSASRIVLVYPRDGATLVLLHHFSWRRTEQPSVYRFLLYEVNRTLVWSALVRDSSLIVPPIVPLHRGRTYLWRVEAILPTEETIHSDLRSFTLSQ